MCNASTLGLMFLGVNEARTIAQGEQQNRIAKFRAAVQNRQADRVRQEASAQGEARAFGARANASELLAGGRAAQQKALLDAGTMAGQNFAKFYSAGTA
mgnify:CR=1 FL=1